MKQLLGIFLVTLFMTAMIGSAGVMWLSPKPALAQDLISPVPLNQIQDIAVSDVTGTLLKIEGATLTVKTDEGVKEFTLSNTLKISRNGMDAPVSDLKPNDELTITQTSAGEVIALSATAGKANNFLKILLTTIVLGLIALGAFFWIIKKTQQPKVEPEPLPQA